MAETVTNPQPINSDVEVSGKVKATKYIVGTSGSIASGDDCATSGGAVYTALTNGTVTKVGTGTVGGTLKIMYLNSGTPTNGTQLYNNKVKAAGSASTIVTSGTTALDLATTAQLTNGSVTKVGTATKGGTLKIMYLNAGTPTDGTQLYNDKVTVDSTASTIVTTGTGALTLASKSYVDGLLAANDAMIFKGTLGTGGTVTALPSVPYNAGWAYKVITAGTYAGKVCEVGDLIICITDRASGATGSNDDWTVIQTNIDGAVTGPASATADRFASFNGTTGKIIKDSGYSASSFATSDHNHDGVYLKLSGGTMTGVLTMKGSQYTDGSGALNMNNSNIYKLNGIFCADEAGDGGEGINFWRSSTSWDSIHAKGGVLYFTPNRPNGEAGTAYTVYHSNNLKSETAAASGTTLSLVTTGEKATWNAKTSNTGTVTTTGTMTSGHVILSNGGTVIKDSGYTIGTNTATDGSSALVYNGYRRGCWIGHTGNTKWDGSSGGVTAMWYKVAYVQITTAYRDINTLFRVWTGYGDSAIQAGMLRVKVRGEQYQAGQVLVRWEDAFTGIDPANFCVVYTAPVSGQSTFVNQTYELWAKNGVAWQQVRFEPVMEGVNGQIGNQWTLINNTGDKEDLTTNLRLREETGATNFTTYKTNNSYTQATSVYTQHKMANLFIQPDNGTYNEGVRINRAPSGWATVMIGCTANTWSNISDGWCLCRDTSGRFLISKANSTYSTALFYGTYASSRHTMTVPHDFVAGTINGLTVTKATTGFTIAGGTTSKTLTVSETYTLGAACAKAVDSSISAASTSANLPTSAAVASFVEGKGYTTNTGTVTQVKIGTTAYDPSSGVVSLPAYPTVNNATLTIQKNGTNVKTFTANASSNVTANIVVNNGKLYMRGDTNVETEVFSADMSGQYTISLLGQNGVSVDGSSQDGRFLFGHSNSVTAGTAGTSSATSGSTLAVPYVTYDAQGHITATGTHTHTVTGFLTSHQTIKQDGITGATVTRYASCTTAAATAAKTASVTNGTFALGTGARVTVKFSNQNSANNPTLNINSTGAKNIFHNGAQITSGTNRGMLYGACDFVYDGTQWLLVGNYINSTYTVNNGTLTIKNAAGTSLGTFTANQSSASNITIPCASQLLDQSVTFSANTDSYSASYPYRASVSVTGITSSTYASVTYSNAQVASGKYAPFCVTASGVVYLYAKTNVGTQTIPTISIGMDYSGNTYTSLTPTTVSYTRLSTDILSGGTIDVSRSGYVVTITINDARILSAGNYGAHLLTGLPTAKDPVGTAVWQWNGNGRMFMRIEGTILKIWTITTSSGNDGVNGTLTYIATE